MSVYSGFATRQQETKYNTLLELLIVTLKKRIIKFYSNDPCDENKFKLLIKKLYKKIFLLQKGKYMPPKYSSCFTDLIDALQIEVNYQSMSDASSMMSQTFSLDEPNGDHMDSKAKLLSKKNFLQNSRSNNIFDSSAFSLSKKQFAQQTQPRSNTLDTKEALRNPLKPTKLRQLHELKELRGTMHMPKMQDFMPKRQPIQHPVPQRKQKIPFRRQKYTREDIHVQQI